MLEDAAGDRPRVSVILPFLDEARFLASAAATVRAQDEPRWELLLVDDGSTDGSERVADELAAADPERIRVLRHPGHANRGLPASRNLGLQHARGEVIAFLDADDEWAPEKLSRQLVEFDRHPDAGMVCGPSRYRFLGADRDDEIRPVAADAPRVYGGLAFARGFVWGALDPPPPSNVAVRARVLRAVGGVPRGPNMYEDQRVFVALATRAPVVVVTDVLSDYTVRADSVYGSVADDGERAWRHRVEFERWIIRRGPGFGWRGALLACEALARRIVAHVRHWIGSARR